MSGGGALRVVIDGAALPESEGRAFWQRFSQWMEQNTGDLAGFARNEGLASVHPEMHAGMAVLVGSRSAPQGAYTSAPKKQATPATGRARGTPEGRRQ
jgi:hypothetical protein